MEKALVNQITTDNQTRAFYTLNLRSSHLSEEHKRKVTYYHPKEPAKAYYVCELIGDWENAPLDWPGVGVYLIEKNLAGHIYFTTDEEEETHLSLHAGYWGESFSRTVSAVIVVSNDVMQFINQKLNQPVDIRITLTLEPVDDLVKKLEYFLITKEDMNFEYAIREFTISDK